MQIISNANSYLINHHANGLHQPTHSHAHINGKFTAASISTMNNLREQSNCIWWFWFDLIWMIFGTCNIRFVRSSSSSTEFDLVVYTNISLYVYFRAMRWLLYNQGAQANWHDISMKNLHYIEINKTSTISNDCDFFLDYNTLQSGRNLPKIRIIDKRLLIEFHVICASEKFQLGNSCLICQPNPDELYTYN